MKNYYKDLAETINQFYCINSDVDSIFIEPIYQYPHLLVCYYLNSKLIVKLVDKEKIYFYNIDEHYKFLESNNYIQKPLKNFWGNYSFLYHDKLILVYKELFPLKNNPDSIWWANCLGSIHTMKVSDNYFKTPKDSIYNETTKLLNIAKQYMDYDIKEKAYKIMGNVEPKFETLYNNFVLCHNNPYNLNVLMDEKEYQMIDTDGMRLLPKEFDIQRLLYNQAITCQDEFELENFWKHFKTNYESYTKQLIDINLLKNIYCCDFIRSLSWLFLVSNDKKRTDYLRQTEHLDLYKKSIMNDTHVKVLKRI